MRKLLASLLISAALPALVYADTVKVYVVNRALLSGARATSYVNVKTNLGQKTGEDIFKTAELSVANTDYFLLKITTQTNAENTTINTLIGAGVLSLAHEGELVTTYDDRYGLVTEYITHSYATPIDLKIDWKDRIADVKKETTP